MRPSSAPPSQTPPGRGVKPSAVGPSKATAYLLGVVDGSRRGVGPGLLRPVLAALALVYAGGLKLYLLPYRVGLRQQYRLPCPVVSVGNLTVGGTGKTPMVLRIARFLAERGVRVCVLSRGYGGAEEASSVVVSTRERVELSPRESGDEAYLLARMLPGVPVVVGRDRRRTGALAIERFQPDVLLLDDGMQFYQLHRDLDIALVDSQRPFDNGWTFPRGLLREPPGHLTRARCVVATNADKVSAGAVARLRTRLSRLAPRARIHTAWYEVECLRALDRSGELPAQWLEGRRVASFSAVGNPGGFEEQLRRARADLVHTTRLPDHHEPTMAELHEAMSAAVEAGAEALLVTEKDAVKLPPVGRPLPVYALAVTQRIDDEASFFGSVLGVLSGAASEQVRGRAHRVGR